MNIIKRYPAIGDIALLIDGNVRFVGQDATKDFVETQQAIGVVFYIQGAKVYLVGGVNVHSEPWSVVCDFEIEEIPSETGDYPVTLQNVALGAFHYEKTTGEISEFVSQLNTWLETNAPKWEAYMRDGKGILQLSDYTNYESNCTISGCKLTKLVGIEVDTDNTNRNQVGQRGYAGFCLPKIIENFRNSKEVNSNPTKRMDGVKQLYVTYPCSEAYYNGELGDGLRANYPTYDKYMEACMVRPFELSIGSTRFNGEENCKKLSGKTVLIRGVETPAYSAVNWAMNYDSGVEGFGKGTWHLASMRELALLMRGITDINKEPLDPVNNSLSKKKGWSKVYYSYHRWSCCRNGSTNAWYFHSIGLPLGAGFYNRLPVSAVSALNLKIKN